jgi:hypothetical protein
VEYALTRDDKEATENFKRLGKDRGWIGGVLQGEATFSKWDGWCEVEETQEVVPS